MTTKKEFETLMAKYAPSASRVSARWRANGEYLYECWDNDDGTEVGFISYHNGTATYHIRNLGRYSRQDSRSKGR